MKKAVIQTGGKQYLVQEGQILEVELLHPDKKTMSLDALLLIDGDDVRVGMPIVDGCKVSVEIVAEDTKAEKVTAIRFKAKKRVHKVHGHRQHLTTVKVASIK